MWVSGVAAALAIALTAATWWAIDSTYSLRKVEWTCVQPYGAPEHECRQWVRTVQRKVAH